MTIHPSLELLFEQQQQPHRPGPPSFLMPQALVDRYGGPLGFDKVCVFANFVASVDGVVALGAGVDGESGHIISQGSEADRFVMGLLRACADAVIVGAETFRKSPGHLWRPEVICPESAQLFAEARRLLGLRPHPKFVLVTGSGIVDPKQPALDDALVVTSPSGEANLRGRVGGSTRLLVIDGTRPTMREVVARLRAEGLDRLLTEGGPTLVSQLAAEEQLGELFLTLSPALFGRYAGDGRRALTEGLDLRGARLELLSARRCESHLFLRYGLRTSGAT
jgi:riboflavin biosynthesis pyrimidine reductase